MNNLYFTDLCDTPSPTGLINQSIHKLFAENIELENIHTVRNIIHQIIHICET